MSFRQHARFYGWLMFFLAWLTLALLSAVTVDAAECGRASWYGPGFHGRLTASGEVYNQWAMTAAHKTRPFGSVVTVTRTDTGASVQVRLTDRGPFIPGRIIDLSRAAADALGMITAGVVHVCIT